MPLGRIHSGICVAQQTACVLAALRVEADPHTCGHQQFMLLNAIGLGQGCNNVLGDASGVGGSLNAAQQDNELVTSYPADYIGLTHDGLHTLRDNLEQLVADFMAKCVVDQLEAIKVHK